MEVMCRDSYSCIALINLLLKGGYIQIDALEFLYHVSILGQMAIYKYIYAIYGYI